MDKKVVRGALRIIVSLMLGLGLLGFSGSLTAKADGKMPGNPTVENGKTVWDCVYFGNYWQSKCSEDDMLPGDEYLTHEDGSSYRYEPVKWRVLSVDGDDAFLMADKNLDVRRYHDTEEPAVTWEDCNLRAWLNGRMLDGEEGFLTTAFTEAELSAIKLTDVANPENPWSGISSGNDTQDYVYLLSVDEALDGAYGFSSNPEEKVTRLVKNTDYANDGAEFYQDISVGQEDGYWLRSSGTSERHPAYVGLFSDAIIQTEPTVHDNRQAIAMRIRPVLHMDLSNTSVWTYAGRVMPDGTTVKEQVSGLGCPVIKSVKNTSGSTVKVTLSAKVADATGYQVQYSVKSSFKGAKAKIFKKTSVTLKNLKNKKYYIRVRAYRKQDGKTVYSSWSKTKTVRVSGSAGSSGQLYSTAHYSLRLPDSWKGCYKADTFEDGDFYTTVFYGKLCNEELPECGWLFSVAEFQDDSYLDFPSYEVLGTKGGVTYIALFPTDVQFEGASAKAQRQYQELASMVDDVLKTFKIK